jgi:ribonuclease P/MRP protein subunit POP5
MMPVRGSGRRYLAISLNGEGKYHEEEVSTLLTDAVRDLFGYFGVTTLEPRLIEFNEESQKGIIRCSRSHAREMRAALALITKISNEDAAVRVTAVSGTIKSLKATPLAR